MSRNKKQKKDLNNKEFKMRSPLDWFFDLGDKVTKGDPIKQQNFQYYMLWIIFLAFLGLFVTNIIRFIRTLDVINLLWGLFSFAVMSLQYGNLKNFHRMRKARKNMPPIKPEEEHVVEDVDDMLKSFNKKNG